MSTTQISVRIPDDVLAKMDRLSECQPFPPTRTQIILDALGPFLEDPGYPYVPLPHQRRRPKP
jgi:metal-responsive CopG/Arc/MetJ family transcriptional regulator